MPLFPVFIFKEVLIVHCDRSWILIVCVCFVVACFKFMPSFSTASSFTWETKTLLFAVIMSVGELACLFTMSMKNFALFTAVGLETC